MPKRKVNVVKAKVRTKAKVKVASNLKVILSSPFLFVAIIGLVFLSYFFTHRETAGVFQISGGNTGTTSQAYGIAARLDGAGYFKVNASGKVNPNLSRGFVAEAWVKPSEPTFTTMGIIDKAYGTKGNFRISTESKYDSAQGKYTVAYDFSVFQSDCTTYNSTANVITYTDPSQVTSWHHVTGVIQPGGQMDIFVDGVRSVAYLNSISSLCGDISSSIIIGAQYNYNTGTGNPLAINFFKGELDEVNVAQYAKYANNFSPSIVPMPRKETTNFLFHLDGNLSDSIKTVNNYYGIPGGSGVTYAPDSIVINPTPTPTTTPIASCRPRPACLDAKRPCRMADRPGMYCPRSSATPKPSSEPSTSPQVCAQVYGTCMAKSEGGRLACVSYSDSCQMSQICVQPLQQCKIVTTSPNPSSTSFPSSTPTDIYVPGGPIPGGG